MKVKFLKNYKKFHKGDIAVLHWTLVNELLKKKIVIKTSEITAEDIFKTTLREEDNGNNG